MTTNTYSIFRTNLPNSRREKMKQDNSLREKLRALWREYKEASFYTNENAHEYLDEIDPPQWFLTEELGLSDKFLKEKLQIKPTAISSPSGGRWVEGTTKPSAHKF